MPYFKFGPNDIFHNRIKTYPKTEFVIYDGRVYYNNNPILTGTQPSRVTNINHVDTGFVSLYELNVDRDERENTEGSHQLIYPFITKHGSLASFKTISVNKFNTDFNYGDIVTGSYPLSATISRDFYDTGVSRTRVDALRTTLDYYVVNSPHYAYSSSAPGNITEKIHPNSQVVPGCDKSTQALNLISVPSIFYGSSIRKGSVHLKFYVSGTLLGELHDINKNGNLIEVTSSVHATGNVGGVVLYNEGFIILTGAWDMHPGSFTDTYKGSGGGNQNPQWVFFGTTETKPVAISSSFHVDFEGVNYIPTLTMMAHAPKGMLNNSGNPTFLKSGSQGRLTDEPILTKPVNEYVESKNLAIKNIVSSSHPHFSESFKKQTYISQIGLFDDDKNLIAIAKLATPVKKTEDREFTFKLKLDF
jgi:hypothetical protein